MVYRGAVRDQIHDRNAAPRGAKKNRTNVTSEKVRIQSTIDNVVESMYCAMVA